MKRVSHDSIRSGVEIVGIIAVVLTLLLVAYEVRQSNRIAEATITYEIGRDVNQLNELGYSNPEFAALLIKLRDKDYRPTGVESLQVRLLANRFMNLWTVQEKAHNSGLLSDGQFEMTKADVTAVLGAFPGLLEPWSRVLKDQPLLGEHVVLEPIVEAIAAEAESNRADQRR